MTSSENLNLVSELMDAFREAVNASKTYEGPLPETITMPDGQTLNSESSWSEIVDAMRLWSNDNWMPKTQELKVLIDWAAKKVPQNSTLGQFILGKISEEEMIEQVSMPVSQSLEQRRQTILEVIIGQAASGEEWQTSLAGLMIANEITVEEVEAELKRRQGK